MLGELSGFGARRWIIESLVTSLRYCLFALPLGVIDVRCSVIVALPGLFFFFFCCLTFFF